MGTHHALLFVGTHDECLEQIPLSARSGVDAEVIVTEQLDIAEARALGERAGSRPIAARKRSFIISVSHIPHEAQNALLKLFEDPPATAQFYIIVPRVSVLLPTLRSRLHLFYEADTSASALDEQTLSFLQSSFNERILAIAHLAKEKEKTKDTWAMRGLIAGIERAAGFGVGSAGREKGTASFLRDALLASTYAETRGASHKMLLEHLALSIRQNMG